MPMNVSTPTLQRVAALAARPRIPWSARRILGLLAGMTRGRLELTLPCGQSCVLGDPSAAPGATMRIHDWRFFRRCLAFGDIGFAESYIAGEWDTADLNAVFRWFLDNLAHAPGLSGSSRRSLGFNVLGALNRLRHRLRPNSLGSSRRNIREHYDLSNPFFATFLDPGMTYSAAWWPRSELTLEEAQTAKFDRLARQLRLRSDDHVLEIGCGWGGFAVHAASRFGCRVTGVTLSREQYEYARTRVAAAGLAERVEIRLEDYRQIDGQFSKIASIEMLEAVGHRYLPAWAETCARLLPPSGLLGLQFIVCPDSRYDQLRRSVDFVQRHIFPGSLLLSLNRVGAVLADAGGFSLHDLLDFGPDYGRTLREWHARFRQGESDVRALGFDEAFVRKWHYYLAYCEAAFASRNISVVQAVYSRPNNPELDRTARVLGGSDRS